MSTGAFDAARWEGHLPEADKVIEGTQRQWRVESSARDTSLDTDRGSEKKRDMAE